MHGGVKFYRGTAKAARAYVESDHSRADDYYLVEGSGLAQRLVATPDSLARRDDLDGDAYEQWVAGFDVETGNPKGRLRSDANGLRFVEVTVNGPKTWSLAAALHPDVSAALDAAQERAAEQIIRWVAQHATTRVGPRGRQVQVPVEQIEAAVIRHYTSRAGDPHRHLHLQVSARVWAAGAWRGLHSVGVRDMIEAINGIGHAAMMTDPQFRAALAEADFTLDPASSEVVELAPFVGRFSERAAQIGRNVDRYEAEWRRANPGQEPGPAVRRTWDRRAWKDARPDKVTQTDGAAILDTWTHELHDLGYRQRSLTHTPSIDTPRSGELDRDAAVTTVITRLGGRRSAWNTADVRGEVEQWVAATGLVADAHVRTELAEDLTARAVAACVPLLDRSNVPEHVRALTSSAVLAVEADIATRLAARASTTPGASAVPATLLEGLDQAQQRAVAALTGGARLVVVEGAAGAGKTTTLAAAQAALADAGRRMLVVTPTLKAAQVASREVGTAGSVAWLVHQHGFRWSDDGRWTRVEASPDAARLLAPGDLLLCDEAGMLDQDTARALLTVADETGAGIALVGDRHQLPAVGRGGVLDLAARWVTPDAHVDLDGVHRFADPEYAAISLALRTGSPTYTPPRKPRGEALGETTGEAGTPHIVDQGGAHPGSSLSPAAASQGSGRDVFQALADRGQVRVYASEAERTQTLAKLKAEAILTHTDDAVDTPGAGTLLVADTRERVAMLNGAVRDRLVASGYLNDDQAIVTDAGERLGVGDRVATRRNDAGLGVANRAVWTVTDIGADGGLVVRGRRPTDVHTLPAAYARQHVELAYATTVYGAQGETTRVGHLLLSEHTSSSSAYVGMTRGRAHNLAHLVADSIEDARQQWAEVFARGHADLGPALAARRAADDVDRYGEQQPQRPLEPVLTDLWRAWSTEADLIETRQRLVEERAALQQVETITARYAPERQRLYDAQTLADSRWADTRRVLERLETRLATDHRTLETQVWTAWHAELAQARGHAHAALRRAGLLGQHSQRVREAHDHLPTFGTRWRTAVPDLPTDPVALAVQLTSVLSWLHSDRVNESMNAYIAERVAVAHPDADAIRSAERVAYRAAQDAERAYLDVEERYSLEVGPYRCITPVTDPTAELARRVESLTRVETTLATTQAALARLLREPALRSLPTTALDAQRLTWQADRTHQREVEARRTVQQPGHPPQRQVADHSATNRYDRGPGIGL